MATLLSFDAADLADGAVLAAGSAGTGDSAVGGATGGMEVDTAVTPYGASGERAFISDNGGVSPDSNYWTLATRASGRARFYFKTPGAWPASAVNSIAVFGAANNGRRFGVSLAGAGSPGQLRVLANSATVVLSTPTNTLALSTWYRVEFWGTITSATNVNLGMKVWDLSDNLLDAQTGVGNPGSTASGDIARFILGSTAGTPAVALPMAHLKVTDDVATDIGPWVAPVAPSTGSQIYVWNGTTEAPASLTIWNGTTEAAGSLSLA